MSKAWAPVFPEFASRAPKPRKKGATMILDKCQGMSATTDLLAMSGEYIDFWKLSYGTSALLDEEFLRRKLEKIREKNVVVFPGGTLTEFAIVQGCCRDFMRHAQRLGFTGVEVSNGTIDHGGSARRDTIRFALDLGLTVLTEVGKKDPAEQPSAEELAEQALEDFDSGASWVIVESRESGRGIGVYDKNGNIIEQSLEKMAAILKDRLDRMIWETPLVKQQDYFILRFGPNVGLGNVQPRDVLALESMRVGIRFETFRAWAEKMASEELQNRKSD